VNQKSARYSELLVHDTSGLEASWRTILRQADDHRDHLYRTRMKAIGQSDLYPARRCHPNYLGAPGEQEGARQWLSRA
jgi:hypothetical protein